MRIRSLALRIVRQIVKDKRTLALMLIAPLLVLTLMKFVFDGQSVNPRVGIVDYPHQIVAALASTGADISEFSDEDSAMRALEHDDLDALVSIRDGQPHVLLEGSSPTKNRNVMSALQEALEPFRPEEFKLSVAFAHGSGDLNIFDYYGSVLVGFFSFFFVFLIAGVSFLRERTTGTLARLLATPLRRWEIVAGYLLGFGIFTLLQATLIAWYSTGVLGIALEGSMFMVLIMNLLLAIAALTLGTLLSAYAQNEFQIFQFIPLVIIPQIFFAGLIELDSMPEWLQALGHALPLYYGSAALRDIMLRGAGWSEVWSDALALCCFSLAFAALNVAALRKHRRI
ncbi:ABC transporter permease [Cohnella panacarvi]|uniref:ABC transporter permease n=1 Tax=Cohnella panacarvi TaxID=400776 RepID=UPI00047909F5|nr:ABC transporter permease [Cohnella panacarvi]